MTHHLTYRLAVAGDEPSILAVFAEVAPEVPTAVRDGTEGLIERLVATGASLVAIDEAGEVVGYALVEGDGTGGISLVYLGVAKAARGGGVCSTIVSQLKKYGVPIMASVRNDNRSSMAERFKHYGFVEHPSILDGESKFHWEPTAPDRPKRPTAP